MNVRSFEHTEVGKPNTHPKALQRNPKKLSGFEEQLAFLSGAKAIWKLKVL